MWRRHRGAQHGALGSGQCPCLEYARKHGLGGRARVMTNPSKVGLELPVTRIVITDDAQVAEEVVGLREAVQEGCN